ncbi:hypothetical protein NFI95_15690 [Acetobacteraceae bacterium KSS8]|uniref:Molecular chaperone DnaJ n=1 Tax=Endosaccharibacter trunci TaxID=2812733 RepID=A0ABT1WC93_9PROT|nr:hypothetical protein [Acetobacteraceae bacterium KSS8]
MKIRRLYLVSHNRKCPGCAGKGWKLGSWTGGDLLTRATVPAYALCARCNSTGWVRAKQVAA